MGLSVSLHSGGECTQYNYNKNFKNTEKFSHTPSELWFLSFTKRWWTEEPSSTLYHVLRFSQCTQMLMLMCAAAVFTYIHVLSISCPPWHFAQLCVAVHCLNVCTKFWDNPSKSLRDISLTITNVNLLVELQRKSIGFILWGARLSVQNVKSRPK